MNREIKFRGLSATGEWVYGLPASDSINSTSYYSEYSQRICWLPETGGYANCPIKNGTLCQFTGLMDKNGKEIYEGDIIQSAYEDEAPEEQERGVVEYGRFNCSCCGGVYGWSISNDKADLRNVAPDSDPALTVIGNLYENPELLQGAD